jgi:diguanylate cyclase (GGDEF)-like protein
MKLSVRINYILLPVIVVIFSLAGGYAYYSQKSQLTDALTDKLTFEAERIIGELQSNSGELKGLTDLFLGGMEVTRYLSTSSQQSAIMPMESHLVRHLDSLSLSYGELDYVTLRDNSMQAVFHYHLKDPFSFPADSQEHTQHNKRVVDAISAHGASLIEPASYRLAMERSVLKIILYRSFSPQQLLTENRFSASIALYTAAVESSLDIDDYRHNLENSFSGAVSVTITPGRMVTGFSGEITHKVSRDEHNALVLESGNAFVKLRLSLPASYIDQQAEPYQNAIISLVINVSLFTFLLLKTLINRQVIKPVSRLTQSVESALAGDSSSLIKIRRRDEIAMLNNTYVELFQSLHKMAKYDELTGLANRNQFNFLVHNMVDDSRRYQRKSALLYVDLDNFKAVNDTYGHHTGDLLLRAFAARLDACLSQEPLLAENGGSYDLARLAGDEFCILLHNPYGTDSITHIAQRIVELCRGGFTLEAVTYDIRISIGIALCPDDANSAESLLQCADLAMYQMKREGKNGYRFYSPAINEEQKWHAQIEAELKKALQEQLFYLLFMPVYDCRSGQVRGAEVLLRSHSELLASCGPAQFIPVAEAGNLIRHIDYWVIESAICSLKQLIDEHQYDGFISVNFSARELKNSHFASDVAKLIDKYAVPAQQLELEITETCLIQADETSIQLLKDLKALGVSLSLDDFGTGYTAFTQLVDYPVDVLKIDRSFVNATSGFSSSGKYLIDIMAEMASLFDLRVIAEGVETQQELDYVRKLGCEQAQGYYLSRPIGWQPFTALLREDIDKHKFTASHQKHEFRLRTPNGSVLVENRDRIIIVDYRGVVSEEALDYVRESIEICLGQIEPATWGIIVMHDDVFTLSSVLLEKMSSLLQFGLSHGCVDAAYIIRNPDVLALVEELRKRFGLAEDIRGKLFDTVDDATDYLNQKLMQADATHVSYM